MFPQKSIHEHNCQKLGLQDTPQWVNGYTNYVIYKSGDIIQQ